MLFNSKTYELKFGGTFGDVVQLNPTQKDFVGAKRSTNNSAELSAVIWIVLYCIQLSQIRVHTDLQIEDLYEL